MILDFDITPQPDDTTCGPACLHAVYRYHGDPVSLDQVNEEVTSLREGGTLAVLLGLHALRRGYDAVIYTCNLLMFDPSWFAPGAPALDERLRKQAQTIEDPKFRDASAAYLEYLALGGRMKMGDITADLLAGLLRKKAPIIVGLSATWLYQCMRERPSDLVYDDTRGEPTGHFVVVHGIDVSTNLASVADPYCHQPHPGKHRYTVRIERLVGAILLGIVTFDAKMLIVTPREKP